jgi:AraC family transcriptional regulator
MSLDPSFVPPVRTITPQETCEIVPTTLSSAGRPWNGLFLAQRIQRDGAVAYPPIDHHLVAFHQTGAMHLRRRLGAELTEGRSHAGSTTIMSAGHDSEWQWQGLAGRICLYISPSLLADVATDAIGVDGAALALTNRFATRDFAIEHIARALLRELQDAGTATALFVETQAQLLAIHLVREHSTLRSNTPLKKGGLAPYALRRVKDFIENHLSDDVTLNDMATAAGLSNFHFCRSFKQSTGMTPHQYQLNRRIERAKELLADRTLSLASLSLVVGFSSQSHFSTAFRKITGTSPNRFRSEL